MKHRVIGFLMALVLIVSTLATCVVVQASAAEEVTVTVGSVSGEVGDVVEVPVSISANSFLVNADMIVTYDATKLELVEYYEDDGDAFCYKVNTAFFNAQWMFVGHVKTPGRFVLAAATGANSGMEIGGEMFRLAFKILSKDANNTQITFEASPMCGNDGSGRLDAAGYPVDYDITYTAVAGAVTVGGATTEPDHPDNPNVLLGDMDGNGVLNTYDALLLYAATSGSGQLTEAQRKVADYTCDGVVNMMDTLQLFRTASGR